MERLFKEYDQYQEFPGECLEYNDWYENEDTWYFFQKTAFLVISQALEKIGFNVMEQYNYWDRDYDWKGYSIDDITAAIEAQRDDPEKLLNTVLIIKKMFQDFQKIQEDYRAERKRIMQETGSFHVQDEYLRTMIYQLDGKKRIAAFIDEYLAGMEAEARAKLAAK